MLQKHLVKITLTVLHLEPMKPQLSSLHVSYAIFGLVPPFSDFLTFYFISLVKTYGKQMPKLGPRHPFLFPAFPEYLGKF